MRVLSTLLQLWEFDPPTRSYAPEAREAEDGVPHYTLR